MCILILMKRDGTLFDVSSVLEEDIVKICIRLGHSSCGCALLFCNGINQQTICNVLHAVPVKIMVSQEEAIAIRASAPSKPHVRTYMTAVGSKPSRTQPPSLGEGKPHSPAGNPHPGGEPLHYLWADLGNLSDHDLCQLMEDLH